MINEPLVIVNNIYVLVCHSRPETILYTVKCKRIDFMKLMHKDEHFCAALQGCHSYRVLLHGNFNFPM